MPTFRIGIIGDFRSEYNLHVATQDAIQHAAQALNATFESDWLATDKEHDYSPYNGLFCSPGSPYKSLEGALVGIRYARENDVPFMGTCAGFQHAVLEYARNVMGIAEAAHEESDPYASVLFLSRLVCTVAGKVLPVDIQPDSQAAKAYGNHHAEENYYCNFGLNPAYQQALLAAGMRATGRDDTNEIRIVELPDRRFFLGTLFVPQARSTPAQPHPLVLAFCRSVMNR